MRDIPFGAFARDGQSSGARCRLRRAAGAAGGLALTVALASGTVLHPVAAPVLGLDAPSPWLVVGLGLVVVGTTIVRRLVKSPSARHLAN